MRTSAHFASVIAAAAAVAVVGSGHAAASPQAVSGKPFGARDSQACGNLKGAAPTQAQAINSFVCHEEGLSGAGVYLHLMQNVSMRIGPARRYNRNQDFNVTNIDITANVYPIRGSFKAYVCNVPSDYMNNRGRNCTVSDHPNASGLCYKASFGDWMCSMGDPNVKIISEYAAPPGGIAVAAAKLSALPNSPQPFGNRLPALPPRPTPAIAKQNGLPAPDFSELLRYVDVISYSYGDNVSDHNLTIVVRPRVNNIPQLCMQFLDRAGGLIDAADSSCGTGIHMGYSPQAGQVTSFDVPMPYDRDTERVAAVKVFRPR